MGITTEEQQKIGSLKHDLQNLNLIVKILNIGSPRGVPSRSDQRQHWIAEAIVGDETGTVILTLWDEQIRLFKANDTIEIKGGYTTLFKGSLRLNVGKGGRIAKIDKEILQVNTKNNLSERTHIQIPWTLSEARPFKSRRRH
ncbi:MAG: single-stranded DNA-binding protein [Candidatus Bathyarchaeia archaeon]